MSNTFFQEGRKIFQGGSPPLRSLVTGLLFRERVLVTNNPARKSLFSINFT